MFQVFDSTTFGAYMKKVRKSLNLTQKDVESLSKINIETLRRLESGIVIPKYETIEYLSEVYKTDLLSVFAAHRKSDVMYSFYKDLDKIIVDYNLEEALLLEVSLNRALANESIKNFVSYVQIEQLKKVVNGVTLYYEESFEASVDVYINAIQLTNTTFSLNHFSKLKYNLLESRILVMLAVALSALKNYEVSNDILSLALKQLIYVPDDTIPYNQIILKIYLNLSYNYFNVNDLDHSLKLAKQGIAYSKANNSIYLLFSLYYRSAVAKYLMHKRGYMNDFRYCMTLLEIQGKKELITIYKDITKKKYDLDI
jgi:transcriptional regulator with XRE-family HTH domain